MRLQRRTILTAAVLLGWALAPGGDSRVLAQAPHSGVSRAETIWTGKSGGCRWKWTTSDLAALDNGGDPVFSAAAMEKKQFDKGNSDAELQDSYIECSIRPLSIVGGIVSYERDYYWEGGAHPSGSIDVFSVDVTRPQHRLLLTDLFPDPVVLKALLADPIIQKILKRDNVTARPRSSQELVKLLKGKAFGGESDSQFGFYDDLLARFAFHHIENGRVAVRLSVSWYTEIYRFQSTQLGLLLPIPSRLEAPLALAATRQQGFLMPEAKRLARDRTTLLFTAGKVRR